MKFNYFIFLAALFSFVSCTDSRLIKYNETKVFPIEVEMNESGRTVSGNIEATSLRKLFDIPSDGKVESFTISGLNLVLERLPASEADLIDYTIAFSNKGETCILTYKLGRDVSVLFGKKSFNISSELNKICVDELECNIYDLIGDRPSGCSVDNLKYFMKIEAKDFTGQPKKFVGKVTGQIQCQVVYSVCESFPKGLFSEYPECK